MSAQPDALTRLLADLVAIPSVNPMGRPGSGRGYCEGEIAAFLEAYLRRHGVPVVLDEVAPGRPNVTAYLDAGKPQTILLEAHTDTVQAGSMSFPPFTPAVRDGRLYGRGACDTKGSLAAFLHAVCSLLEDGERPSSNILLLASVDEEYGFTGARHAVRRGLKADFGVVGEPTGLAIVRAHKGAVRWRVVTRGVAAHSAYPERGRNAIFAMAPVLARLEEYAGVLRSSGSHPLLGARSLSAGVIEGGEAVNIVPDRCAVELDRRTLPGETPDDVIGGARDALHGIAEWEFEPPHLVAGGMELGEDSPPVRLLSGAIDRAGEKVRIETAQYATDAGILSAAGVPCVVFGPGDIAQAHTTEEWIDIEQLRAASRAVRRLISGT